MFQPWPKIKRIKNLEVVITEKMDGTNGAIVINNGVLAGVQSRNREITPEDDNYGFARWVHNHKQWLAQTLGDGYHYGEWAGPGIQKNRHGLEQKTFFLFNSSRWSNLPSNDYGLSCVPLLFDGAFYDGIVADMMLWLLDYRKYKPEGLMIYWKDMDTYLKHTLENPEGKWKENKEN